MERRLVAGGVVALVLVAGAYLAGRSSAPSAPVAATPPAVPESARDDEREDSEAAADAPARANGSANASTTAPPRLTAAPLPLPRADAPLTETYDDLVRRANAGDARAACRLAQDLTLCTQWRNFHPGGLKSIEEYAARAQSGSPQEADAIAAMQQMQRVLTRGDAVCTGADTDRFNESWKFLLRAAELGDTDAAAQYAIDPPLNQAEFLRDLDAWVAYRDRARPLLRGAVESGNPRALYRAFRLATGRTRTPRYSPIARQDWRTAAVLATVLKGRVEGRAAAEIDEALAHAQQHATPVERAELDAAATRLQAMVRDEGVIATDPQGEIGYDSVDCATR